MNDKLDQEETEKQNKEVTNVSRENVDRTNYVLISHIKDKGFRSLAQFAWKLTISRQRLYQIINGTGSKPSEEIKIAIAKALEKDSRVIFPEKKEVRDDE